MKHVSALILWALVSAPAAPASADETGVDRIVIDKSERQLRLLRGERAIRTFRVALGAAPKGHKRFEGDQRTPEGIYNVDLRNADSSYYRALRISYPNEADRMRALDAGLDPGGQIMIHGLRNGQGWLGERHLGADWTDGCIAVTNAEMDEIWKLVDLGTPVEIRP